VVYIYIYIYYMFGNVCVVQLTRLRLGHGNSPEHLYRLNLAADERAQLLLALGNIDSVASPQAGGWQLSDLCCSIYPAWLQLYRTGEHVVLSAEYINH
jgi:hypothetical protein